MGNGHKTQNITLWKSIQKTAQFQSSMNASDCSAVCGSDAASRATAEFWLERVGVPLVGTAGLLGNIAAIAVLR